MELPQGLPPLYALAFAVGTTLALLIAFRVGQRFAAPKATLTKDFAENNGARHMLHVGQIVGVFIVAASVVRNCVHGQDLSKDLLSAAGFGALGLALIAIVGRLSVHTLMRSALPAEITRGNVAAGLAAGSQYVAVGIIASNAVAGSKPRDVGLSLLFFCIAIVTLLAFVTLFRVLTTYDDSDQIKGENLAAALSYAGMSIAVAIIVGVALDGDFVSWEVSLKGYGAILLLVFALYPVRQLFVQSLLLGAPFALRGGRLDVAVGTDRNEGLGALEAATYLATALSVARLV